MKKKVLALIMCIVMVTAILPVYAFAETNPAQEPTGASLIDLTETYADVMERTVADNIKFLQGTSIIHRNDTDKETYSAKQLNLGELARAIAWFNHFGYVPDDNLSTFLNELIIKGLITSTQSNFIIDTIAEIKTQDYTWMYRIISEEEKTAEISGVLVIKDILGEDVIMPQEIDGYTMVATVDRLDYKIRGGLFEPRSIYFPDTYKWIGGTFSYDNDYLVSLRFPDNLEWIGLGSFDACTYLWQGAELDQYKIRYFGEYCFGGYSYNMNDSHPGEVVIRPGTTLIKGQAFSQCDGLKKVILPEGLKTVCSWAFMACDDLKSIVLPSSMTRIEKNAFMIYSLDAIYIPESVTYIDDEGIGGFDFSEGSETYLPWLNIYGVSGSAAEEYAQKYNLTFIDVNDIVYGDVDGDGTVTIADYATAKTVVSDSAVRLDGNAEIVGDMNADQVIDSFDLFEIDRTINA